MRNYDSRKRILVTGGAGFLGSHLCDRLLEQATKCSNEFRIVELAQRLIAITGSASKIEKKPLPSDDPAQRQPDMTLPRVHLRSATGRIGA